MCYLLYQNKCFNKNDFFFCKNLQCWFHNNHHIFETIGIISLGDCETVTAINMILKCFSIINLVIITFNRFHEIIKE